MNHLSIVESWIFNEMLNDSELTSIVGDKIYIGAPEDEAGDLFVVVSYVDSRPFYNLGTKREHSWSEYDIMVWQAGKDVRMMKAAANRIDEMFSIFRNRTFYQGGETFNFYSRLMRSISRKDTSQLPLSRRGMGGTYRVSATKV